MKPLEQEIFLVKMLYKSNFSIKTAVAIQSGAMEADTISKNGRSLKSQISRIIIVCFALLAVCSGCEPTDDEKDGRNGGGSSKKAPTGVTAIGSSSSSIIISWNAVTDANYYKIWRSDDVSGPYVEINNMVLGTFGTTYTNNGLSPYTTFYYKVAANDGAQSNAVSATTFLIAPSGVKATSETSSSVTISWENLSGATSYCIHRMANSFDQNSKIFTSSTTSFTDTGLPANVQCRYAVSGNNNVTEGDKSSYVEVTTLLKAPTGVTANAISSTGITITWNAVTDASYYKIWRSDNASGPYIEINSMVLGNFGTSYTNNGLSPSTTFFYKVAANNGEQSNVVSATTY